MRILLLSNNWVGWKVAEWLRLQNEEIVGLVLHPEGRRKYGTEIIASAKVSPQFIFDGAKLRMPEIQREIAELHPDIGVSGLFGYILQSEFIQIFPKGIVNLHPAYLPYNRGQYPNVWSIIEGTPAGSTLHYIDAGIDTGEIIARSQVETEPIDTGESLYHKLEQALLDLFKKNWPLIRSGKAPRIAQFGNDSTLHKTGDVEKIDFIDLDKTYKAGDLINILRARTFPPHRGAYFKHHGRKVYMRLQLFYKDDPC